ncbi:hypothetical protein BSKO_09358 [Bryopsis sp. KO-2023]|nr:hypothetical protein BSKO_09358 [Bryopsis sp. KO-2023]
MAQDFGVVKRLTDMGMIIPAQINNKNSPDAETMEYIENMKGSRQALEDNEGCRQQLRSGAVNIMEMQAKLLQMNTDQPSIISGRFAFDMVSHALEMDAGGEVLRLDLPLDDSSIEKLKTHCTDSLVGLGGAPFRDRHLPKIRSCLELNADCVKLPPKIFNFDFADVLDHIKKKLMPSAAGVEVKLHKLLVYPKGAFFKGHVDTVNDEDHFGTLSLPLPCRSASTGGSMSFYQGRGVEPELWRKYEDLYSNDTCETAPCPEIVTCDFNATEDWGVVGENRECLVPFVAWLTDIPHAILPVEEGHRVVLVFKLFKTGGPVDVPVDHTLSKSLWQSLNDVAELPEDAIRGVGIMCRHSYPPAALQPGNLKLVDADLHRALKHLRMVPELLSVVEMRSALYEDKGWRWAFHQGWLAECKVWMRKGDKRFDYPEYDLEATYDRAFVGEYFSYAPPSSRFQSLGPSACLQRMVYLHLGCGRMVAEGEFYYGIVSGSSHWWYQHSILGAVLSAVHRDGLPLLKELHQACPHIFKQICRKLLQ